MPFSNQSIDSRLLAAQVATTNSLNDAEIQGYLTPFGYDTVRLEEGKALYETALALHQKQKVEYGEQFAATDARDAAQNNADAEYMRFVKIARVALKNDRAAAQKLGIDGRRKQTFSGWLSQVKQFYANALPDADILSKLAGYGVTPEKLQAGQQLTDEAEAANAAREKEKGEAQQATKDRDEAVDIMDEWMSDFKKIARIALADKPQLLEKLGILERS